MNGITIVEEHLCRVVELGELIGSGFFITLLFCCGLLLYRFMYKEDTSEVNKKIIIVCSVLLVAMYIWFWIFQIDKYNTTYMEYTVTVDNNISFNEFHTKYEIISINGNEYRVVEK